MLPSSSSRLGTGMAIRRRCGAPGRESELEIKDEIRRRERKYPHMKGSRAKRPELRGRWVGDAEQRRVRRSIMETAVPMPRRVRGMVRTTP